MVARKELLSDGYHLDSLECGYRDVYQLETGVSLGSIGMRMLIPCIPWIVDVEICISWKKRMSLGTIGMRNVVNHWHVASWYVACGIGMSQASKYALHFMMGNVEPGYDICAAMAFV